MTLYYVGDTTEPARQKFYGDVSQKLTAISTGLVFFELEFNRLDGDALARAMSSSVALGHYKPWIDDLRKEKPYQLEDRVEQLFVEKSVTAAGAWNRLFDETMAALKFDVQGEELELEPTLNMLVSKDGGKRKTAAAALAKVFKQDRVICIDHQHACQGQGNFRPLAGFQGCGGLTPSGQPGGSACGGSAG